MRKIGIPYGLVIAALTLLAAAVLIPAACKEAYVPPVVSTNTAYLVVDGFINNGTDSTLFNLSRSFELNDGSVAQPELHAQLAVQGTDNSSYPLIEIGNGRYAVASLALNAQLQYRLHIQTADNKEYVSDFLTLKASPPIDSISWQRLSGGLQIYANTHDPQNASRYYRWEYQQTWQFNSIFYSIVQYVGDSIKPRPINTFYTCWQAANSTSIELFSTARLSTDIVSQFPLVLIPSNSWWLSLKYSILVKQYTLSAEAYQFWSDLQKNTEQIGSVFSPEPSQSKGNIHSVTDSSEMVIGYISAGTYRQQRIYIVPDQIPNWDANPYEDGCVITTISTKKDTLSHWLGGSGYLPIALSGPPPVVYSRVDISQSSCVDCTIIGTNIKPAFWQ